MRKLLRRIQYFLHRDRIDADLAEEMEFHRDMLARELAGDRTRATRALGNTTLARENARGVWLLPWIESLGKDIAYGLRGLRRQPGFSLVSIAALSIAIGLNTALFTFFNAVAFRPWPVNDPERVVTVTRRIRKGPDEGHTAGFGVAEWRYLSEHSKAFRGLILTGGGERVEEGGRQLRLRWVTGNYFSVLRLDMERGRGFGPEEDRPLDPQAVAILTYKSWQNKFGGDPTIIGRTLRFDDVPFTIVGVAPDGFTGTADTADLWAPFSAHLLLRPLDTGYKQFLNNPNHCCVGLAGRLAPGVTRSLAASEIDVLMRQFHEGRESEGSPQIAVAGTALLDVISRRDKARVTPFLAAMFVATTLVLLLACANVGNLLLARSAARHTEIAVRLSLGGTRARLVRQLLVESMVLAIFASGIGLAIAMAATSFVPRLSSDLGILQFTPDLRVCAYLIALAVVACIVFGLAPALHGTRGNIAGAIKSESRVPGGRLALRNFLLASQVAISVILLAGAGLLVRGLQAAQHREVGFRLEGVSVATLTLPANAYNGLRLRVLTSQLEDALSQAAGMPQCALSSDAPMANSRSWTHARPAGEAPDRDLTVQIHDVTGDYFDVLRIRVVEGRNLVREDAVRDVVLLNQTAAARLFHGASPIGKSIFSGRNFEVVGIVKDAYTTGLDTIEPTVYFPMTGKSGAPQLLMANASPVVVDRIASLVQQIEPRARITFIPLTENFQAQLEPARYAAIFAGALGMLALSLASIGMCGVFAYMVRQRTREIGVRMALGARPGQVVGMVLKSHLRALAWGVAAGLAGAIAATRLLRDMMNGVSPFDPLAYAGVLALLIAAAAAASAIPARHAARIDPVTALRWE
jgi:predicted permease